MRISATLAGQVLQPADGRLRAQLGTALGQPADRHLERRVRAQGVAVVGVRVAGSDHQGPETDHLGEAVPDPIRITRVGQTLRQALGDAQTALDLGQHQDAGIRGQPATIESHVNRLARNR